jgi:magnesium transporter
LFIPVVLNLAESVSSQSVSLTLLLGAACGAVLGGIALAWLGNPGVSLSLLGGISGGVAIAAVLGLALPVALRMVSLDPKVAAGPIALAVADVLTLLLYLGLARWLLR